MTASTPPTPPADQPDATSTAEQAPASEHPASTEHRTAEPQAASHPGAAEPTPGPRPAGPPTPFGYPPTQFGPPPPYASNPFAPRVREPWVNPAKRGVVGAIGVVAALVLVGGGVAIGAAATGNDRHGPPRGVQMRPYQGQPGMRLPLNQRPRRPAGVPGRGRLNAPRPATPPTTAPTPAPSSSHS